MKRKETRGASPPIRLDGDETSGTIPKAPGFAQLSSAIRAAALALCAAFLFGGCKNDSFHVWVVTPDRKPVAGALVHGGFDWSMFGDQTDDAGLAQIPNWADGWDAKITKGNFYSASVKVSPCARFTLRPTSESLMLIGEVEGSAIRFGPETLITVTYQGQYRVYTYGETQLTEHTMVQLPSLAKERCMRGDTFWYATHDSGLFAFSLADPLNPIQLMHLDIGGYLGPFVVVDTFVVVGDRGDDAALRVYRYRPEVELVASIGDYRVDQMAVISHYLVIAGYKPNLPVVFDIADISNPHEVYHGVQTDFWAGHIFDHYVVLRSSDLSPGLDSTYCRLLDLADPAHPTDLGLIPSDAWLDNIINDSIAVGDFIAAGQSVLRGRITEGFHSVALVNAGSYSWKDYGGSSPPFFILRDGLWKLSDRGQK
jgi:hypothetical protein